MNEFLYVEKYRPQTIDDTILPKELKETFKEFVKNGEVPNLLLCGSAGVGKTTVAKALCEQKGLDYEYKMLDADFTAEELFEKVPNARTFPQIWIDEKHVGGYVEVRALEKEKKLLDLVK